MSNAFTILKNLEYLLWVVIIVSLGYVGHFFFTEMRTVNINLSSKAKISPVQQTSIADISPTEVKPYQSYEKQITTRDIFSNFLSQNASSRVEPAVPSGELPGHLKIVGIMLGKSPQVVIENTSAHQTYFIEKNYSQAGISIDRVENNKLLLIYNGQTVNVDLKGSEINVKKTNP